MKLIFPIILIVSTILFSCGQGQKSASHVVSPEKETSPTATVGMPEIQKGGVVSKGKYIDTHYVYADAEGKEIIIENSLPRGGLKYIDPAGKEYIYAVFWTRITNETDNPFALTMGFTQDSSELPSSPGRYFRLFIPSDTITAEKEDLFNYGLDLKQFLDTNFDKQARLSGTIHPQSARGFYVVVLFNRGVDGTIRSGLSLRDENLIYRVNDKEIPCGQHTGEGLKLRKEE